MNPAAPRPASGLGLALAIALALVVGCGPGRDYQRPDLATPAAWNAGDPTSPTAPVAVRWWSLFNDAELDALVARAARANFDLAAARARIREARAVRGEAYSYLGPTIDAFGSAERSRRSLNSSEFNPPGLPVVNNLYQAGFDANWEIDLFGTVQRGVEAADADLAVAEEGYRDVLVTLLAEVGRAWFDLKSVHRRLDLARERVANDEDYLGLAASRHTAGIDNQAEVALVKLRLAQSQALIPPLETDRAVAMHRLALLLAQQPNALVAELDAALARSATIPLPNGLAAGLPSELLLRRPDLRRSERALAAATAKVGVAEGDLFPRISLTGSFGLSSISTGSLLSSGSWMWSVGPSVRWPIFSMGRVKAEIRAADARSDEALAAYEKAVYIALGEVEDALVAHARELQAHGHLEAGLAAAAEGLAVADERYRHGVDDYRQVLLQRRTLIDSRLLLSDSDHNLGVGLIALAKALGGGWEDPGLTRREASH